MLTLIEKIMLLSIDEKKNKISMQGYNFSRYGPKAAAILNLIELNKIKLENKKIVVTDTSSSSDNILDDVLEKLSSKPINLNTWLYSYTVFERQMRIKALNNLEEKGIIMQEEKRFLGLIPYKKYIIYNNDERQTIKNSIREKLLSESTDASDEIIAIISLAAICGSLKMFFNNTEMKQIKKKIKSIKKAEYFKSSGEELKKILKGIQNAMASRAAAGSV